MSVIFQFLAVDERCNQSLHPACQLRIEIFYLYFNDLIFSRNLYPLFLHDLSIGLHAECLYFPDCSKSRRLMMNPEKLELLITREMPFGKYKGRIIADLPGQYLNWFAREGFPHGELGGLLALMQEIDHNGLSELLEPLRAKHGKPAPRH
jgi:uncharacterized protein (DUF3820 family)